MADRKPCHDARHHFRIHDEDDDAGDDDGSGHDGGISSFA